MRSLLLLPTIAAALRMPIVDIPSGTSLSRGAFIQAASLSLAAAALPAHAAELSGGGKACTDPRGMCSDAGKTQLAAYDQMLLSRAKDELSEMAAEVPSRAAAYDECKRLVALTLDLDWSALGDAAKTYDPEKASTKKLIAGVQQKDPKATAKAVLDLADDLDVAAFSSAGTGQPALR